MKKPSIDVNLSDADLLKLLDADEDQLSRAVVDEILRRKEQLTPALLAILGDRGRWDLPAPACCAPMHAAVLLASFHPPGLLTPLLRAVRTAFELDELFVADHADLLLAACGPEALEPLVAVALNRKEPFEMRLAINEAVARIGLAHPSARPAARTHLLAVAQSDDDPELRNLAAYAFAEFATPKDRDVLRELEKDDVVDRDVVEMVQAGRYPAHYATALDVLDLYDPETVAERKKFLDEIEEEPPEADLPDDPSLEALAPLDEPDTGPMPIVNASPKVGRNDPCPCGSGRKHKKCCGA